MNILITKQNQNFFLDFDKKLKFEDKTKNTCTFKVSNKKFYKLLDWIRAKGLNPYALIAW